MPLNVPVLVITGTVGAGKTVVGAEISRQLQASGVPHHWQDLDALTYTFPRPARDPRGLETMRSNLTFIWHGAIDRGAEVAVLAGRLENAEEIDLIRRAIPGAAITTVQIVAPKDQLATRLTNREVGIDHDWSLRESIELDQRIFAADFTDALIVHDSSRLPTIAAEVIDLWTQRIAERVTPRTDSYGYNANPYSL
jgi:dephospho-CoA kinase